MSGYNVDFLETPVPLPTFSMRLAGQVLRKEGLRDGVYRDYIHYSVAMHSKYRAPVFAALNINQKKLREVKRGGWNIDPLIGFENQLDNAYYYKNRWDRGHIARRASAAHGDSVRKAKQASDSTMFYTNACLQFDSFNQDEWLDLEDWVLNLMDDKDDRISVFSGPIWGEDPLYVVPENRAPAEVPAAFFKVVCFTNKRGEFEVRAFNVPQDQRAMADWQGRNRVNRQTYQTTIAEIEHLTGIEFPDVVAENNPLLYHESPENLAKKVDLNIEVFPENIPVDRPEDMTAEEERRLIIADDKIDVFIVGALPNPKGRDQGKEWVSLINLEQKSVDLTGWELSDNQSTVKLTGKLLPGMSKKLQGNDLGALKLSNKKDILTLKDAEGRRIDRVRWIEGQAQEGRALYFPGRSQIAANDTTHPQDT